MTKIQWTNETWNPIVGCSKISAGCQNCYAEKMARRLATMGQHKYKEVISEDGKWYGNTEFDESDINKPFGWKKSKIIFVCSMGDLFHESLSFSQILEVFYVIAKCPQHIFQILTKRPERMREFFTEWVPNPFFELFPNVWLGVTAENQEQANKRIPILLQIPAAKRFVSIEPMLGPVDFDIEIDPLKWSGYTTRNLLSGCLTNLSRNSTCATSVEKIDWIIVGAESGPKRRPMEDIWPVTIKDQCEAAGVPFFFKQKYIGSKKICMPTIDGKIWDQMPER